MRPATRSYLAEMWPPRPNRQAQRNDAPPCTASRPRRARGPRREPLGRGLLTVPRRVFAVLNGTSQAA